MADAPRTVPPPAPPADAAVGYRPLAGLAIAALAVAILTAVVVTSIAVASQVKGRAILAESVVALALFGLLLSLVARWQIRRSEGTRAGLGLTKVAMWLCVVFGLGYAAFLIAIGWAVRMQARDDAADKWFAYMAAEQPELAFRLTRDPSQQRSIPESADAIRRRFGATDLPSFNASDISRQYRTWKGKVLANCLGVKQLQTTPVGYEVELNYQLRSPEGRFDVGVTALSSDDPESGKRGWQMAFNRTGIREKQSTRLGQICDELRFECSRRFLPQWAEKLPNASEEPLALFRIDGNSPPEAQREKLAKELRVPMVINVAPGGGMQPVIPPILRFDTDGVRLVSYAELILPTLGEGPIPCYITVQLNNNQLTKEMIELQNPGWEQQPIQARWDVQLKSVPDLKVVEINARPGAPREGPQMRSVQTGG